MAKSKTQGNKSGKSKPSPSRQDKKQENKPVNPRPNTSRTDEKQDNNPIISKPSLSRKEWWILIGAVITGGFTLIGAIITVLGPPIIGTVFPKETLESFSAIGLTQTFPSPQTSELIEPTAVQSPLQQATLSLPQFAPSLTSSCDQNPPEPVAVVDQLSESLASPLRFDFVVVHPAYNLLPEVFNPTSDTFSDEASIKQLPAVDRLEFYVDIVGLNEKEWIRAENFVLLRFNTIKPFQAEEANVAVSIYGGGSRTFHTTACWQGSIEPNIPFATSRVTSADIFTLSPGELIPIWLTLDLSGLVPAVYDFQIGVVYTYEGQTSIAWSDRTFSLTVPDKSRRTDWIYYPAGNGITFIPDN